GEIDVKVGVNMADALCMYAYCNGQRSYLDTNKDVSLIWKTNYADAANGFADLSSVESAEYYFNSRAIKDYSVAPNTGDAKQIFYNDNGARVVNVADGYVVTLPFTDFTPDYSLGALRSRYINDSMVLGITYEDKNPYGNNADSWNTYLTEWLNRFIADNSFLSYNNIERTRAVSESTSILPGYTVLQYDMHLKDDANLDYPYYQIAVIRPNTSYNRFYMVHLKSKTQQTATIDTIVKSFKTIVKQGAAKNVETTFACEVPENWNDATKAYYQKLMEQDATDWGFFSASMASITDSNYDKQDKWIGDEYERLSTAMDYEYDIMPTYTHLCWGSTMAPFPIDLAKKYAGGNGFNGKPVLQFTYQFTSSNNTQLSRYTPMFDILRGEYDEQFRSIAREIKAYKQPVLFRLNNEMNTDWTSYCGMVTLLDPDIFAQTWERLYRIFEEEGVDNCIWIFNPFATSIPYSRWGDYLAYLPDIDTVQVLGLTAYEMGNGTELRSFESYYKELYEKNTPYFDNYPWIISEFAAGAGGEKQYNYSTSAWEDTVLGRNGQKQAAWVEAMFENLSHRNEPGYEYCKNIKGAVWFSANDYTTINDVNYISNYLALDEARTETLEAFRKGLNP
ncbi:MAG: hypothetical protein IJC52_05010, partial [Clostridia bacterium]|nr:hypothetical protein [Clostridia bacterium]